MALTVSKISGRENAETSGAGWRTVRRIAFDASYTTGGLALTKAQLGFSKAPDWVEISPKQGYTFEYVPATEKVKVYQGDNTNVAAAPGIEVANATNLSALVDVLVKSYGLLAA
jgi:hypothetical protein